ncbi:hypothetical protein HBA92_02945 [Ochrobactrum sp. MR28]|jgi:hypothetical protein|nr:hypothetical protein [Ochrobactrum sp. MR28]MBX8815547.1 hypothetical protein [Ochrobactrum sp. MR31]MDR2310982.1 hypothetical protein [Brucellaceae bacterium]
MQVSKVAPYNPLGTSHDPVTAFTKKANSEIQDISCLIEDAQMLSNKIIGIVAAIIGDTPLNTSSSPKAIPLGVLNQLVDRSRHVRTDMKSAGDALDRLANSFGL